MLSNRIFQLNNHKFDDSKNTIVYWITREFRSSDNWSLVFSQKLANKHQKQLIVLINLLEESNIDYIKPFNFFIEGLFELKENLSKLNIPLHISYGKSSINIPNFLDKVNAGALVTDFFPLKYYQKLANDISNKIEIPIYEIDSHNIVPCRIASQKLEYQTKN